MLHWVMTAPDPRITEYGYGNAQRGWRFHAVEAPEGATFESIRCTRSLCGRLGKWGWGMDLYADETDHCEDCHRKAGLPPTTLMLARHRIRASLRAKRNADCDGDPSCRTHRGGMFGSDASRECRRDVRRY